MAIELAKTTDEVQQMPLVELAWEILKVKKEPFYFRDLMNEIQQLRQMSEEEVMDVIARLYTEINIDGRFVCIGHNVWGLKRWYPVDKVAEKTTSGKRFVRSSGDAFSDDDEDLDEDFDDIAVDEEAEDVALLFDDKEDDADLEADAEDELVVEDEDNLFGENDEDAELEEEPLVEGEDGEELEEEEED